MPISEAGIANIALTALGARPITSLDDDNTEAKIADIHYDASRDATLEAREWTFAVKRTTLPKNEKEPDWGYGAAFTLPADTLRVMEVRDDANANRINYNELANRLDWRREENLIVCDANIVRIRYIAQITDTNRFSPGFVQCFAARLAMDICVGITQSSKMLENMSGLYAIKLAEAAATDGMQGRIQIARSSKLTGVRGQGESNSFASGVV